MRNVLVKVAARPVEVAAREFVSVAIDAHRINPRLHRVLAEQIPRIGRLENVEAVNRDVHAVIRGYLEAHRDEIDVADLDVATFICVTAVEALTHTAVLRRPDILTGEKAEIFVEEVTDLVVRYLQKRDRRRRTPSANPFVHSNSADRAKPHPVQIVEGQACATDSRLGYRSPGLCRPSQAILWGYFSAAPGSLMRGYFTHMLAPDWEAAPPIVSATFTLPVFAACGTVRFT